MKKLEKYRIECGETVQIGNYSVSKARYSGVYEGGKYVALNCSVEDVPYGAFGDDCSCANFWSNPPIEVGRGFSPEDAIADLERQTNAVQ